MPNKQSTNRRLFALRKKLRDLEFAFAAGTLTFLAIVLSVFFYTRLFEISYVVFLLVSILLPYALYYFVDHFLFHDFDTLRELRRGNRAVGAYILGYAIIAAAAILAASGALGTIFGAP